MLLTGINLALKTQDLTCKIGGVIVNDDGFILCGCFNAVDPRVDRWFSTGKDSDVAASLC